MNTETSLLGSWVSEAKVQTDAGKLPQSIWHFVDERTCVHEDMTDMGPMVSWFQYWPTSDGIMHYPLSKRTRFFFKVAEHVPITMGDGHINVKEYHFDFAEGLTIPERIDRFPGTRPDKDGNIIRGSFKEKLQDYLPEPPTKLPSDYSFNH